MPCCGPEFFMYVALCVALVLFAALMAGLTMALMSLDSMNISIIEASGSDRERGYARAIAPIIRNKHLLLVTLLIGNASAMEALPIFLDRLVPGYAAILLSVTLVLAFGEIIPQAVFTKYRLPIGAHLAGFVRALELLLLPVACAPAPPSPHARPPRIPRPAFSPHLSLSLLPHPPLANANGSKNRWPIAKLLDHLLGADHPCALNPKPPPLSRCH